MVEIILNLVYIIVFALVIVRLAFYIGKDIGVSEVWDIPKGGKSYLVVGVGQKSHSYFASGLPDENTYVIVYAVGEKKPRLVELTTNKLTVNNDSAKEECRVGDWIFKTAAGDYHKVSAVLMGGFANGAGN